MRLMFFVLLIINLSYLSWHMAVGLDTPASSPPLAQWESDKRLDLVEERVLVPELTEREVDSVVQAVLSCLGPFDKEIDATDALNRLRALGQSSVLRAQEVTAEQDYWVFMPSMASSAEALATIEQLKSAQIEAFLIQNGDDSPGVSIGLYTQKKNAQQQQLKVEALGLVSQTREIQRYRQQYALLLTSEMGINNVDDLVDILRGSWPNIQSQENLCKAVAPG